MVWNYTGHLKTVTFSCYRKHLVDCRCSSVFMGSSLPHHYTMISGCTTLLRKVTDPKILGTNSDLTPTLTLNQTLTVKPPAQPCLCCIFRTSDPLDRGTVTVFYMDRAACVYLERTFIFAGLIDCLNLVLFGDINILLRVNCPLVSVAVKP